ncbi:GIY-YIG nuclease family protein [Nocardia fusca]|uniref:GIY-YIG nuclease family protein n=1 Tax=Nocardia fusca TaxID=941183 RepID=UPI0037C95ECD
MNWTGHVVAAPRSDLATLLERPEAGRTGIYVLLGDDPESVGGQSVYIGEGDIVRNRLIQHARPVDQRGKDFWDRAIVLTSKDTNLTKAHARYLESRFIEIALQASRAQLVNATAPSPLALPEADVSDMEQFIEQAKIVLPVLGVNIFRSPAAGSNSRNSDATGTRGDSILFELTVRRFGIVAAARDVDGEFTVLEGSKARSTWIGTDGHSYRALRDKLEQDGTLVPASDGLSMYFARNHAFASPSAAAAVVAGRAANGRTDWVIQGSRTTYGEWEAEGIEEALSSGDFNESR